MGLDAYFRRSPEIQHERFCTFFLHSDDKAVLENAIFYHAGNASTDIPVRHLLIRPVRNDYIKFSIVLIYSRIMIGYVYVKTLF